MLHTAPAAAYDRWKCPKGEEQTDHSGRSEVGHAECSIDLCCGGTHDRRMSLNDVILRQILVD
jgi:hypothetical protein